MISTDRTILEPGSPARLRMEGYAQAFEKLSIIIFAKRNLHRTSVIGIPLSLYPTDSASRFTYMHDALRTAATIPKFDVVSSQDPFETGIAALRIAKRFGVPLHVQVHTDFLSPGFAFSHFPLNLIRLFFASRVLKYAARIRAVSNRVKEHVQEHYQLKAPISVLPIFVDTIRFKAAPHEAHPKFKIALLVVSRLEKEKRIDIAIRALKMIRDAGIDAGMDIVGTGSEESYLKSFAAALGLAAHIEFHGFQKETAPYYLRADVLLYPGARYEGFGMGILESLASGVPVVAFDIGIAKEAGAVVVNGSDPADFAKATIELVRKSAEERPHLLLYKPYASKEEYLSKLKADLTFT